MDNIGWRTITYQIPISTPPEVVGIGVGIEGHLPVQRYKMSGLWCMHLYRYHAKVIVDGRELPIHPGYIGIIPADTPMEYHFGGRSQHIYVHLKCTAPVADEAVPIPAMIDCGDNFGRIYELVEQVLGSGQGPKNARVWDVLWQISGLAHVTREPGPALHPAVAAAFSHITRSLGDEIRVEDLANRAGVTSSHLGRLFQSAYGKSVVATIRDLRVQRANHLLCRSTLAIKTIAITVGIPDLQHFNKTIHRCLHMSPTDIRRTAETHRFTLRDATAAEN